MKQSRFAVRGIVTAFVALFALAACSDDPIGPREATDVEFAPELGVNIAEMERLPGGVYIQTLQEGEGREVVAGEVIVAYTLWLWTGEEIDSGNNFQFELDSDGVITGFNAGVKGMKVGETRLIVVPPLQGYGFEGSPQGGIPGNAVLVFRVELIEDLGLDGPS